MWFACVIAFQCELSLVSSTIAFSLLIVLSTIFYLALILFYISHFIIAVTLCWPFTGWDVCSPIFCVSLSHFINIVDIGALLTKYMPLFLLIWFIYVFMFCCVCAFHVPFPILIFHWFNCSPLPQIHASWGCQSLVGLDVWR